jgi:catechol 2,3-dioxygenase-like lactoylglutathione lyase family enzyme
MPGPAVHSLDHFALSIPSPEGGGAFYTSFGLTSRATANALRLETPRGLAGFLYEGPRKRLHHLTFGVDAVERDLLKAGLERGGVTLLDPPRDVADEADGLWFRDDDGNLVQIAVTPNRSPRRKSELQAVVVSEGERGAPEGPQRVTPRRLGHTLLFSPDVLRAVAFYERFLGLRLSDRSGEVVAFMHTPHGSDHHILAFGKSDRPGFHHASFELGSVDEIGIGAMYMQALGHNEGWGFGRHYIGSNYFYYVRDPWGSFAEYFCDIDYIPQGCAWEGRDVPAEHALYVWGPPPPDYFFQNVEG